MTTTQEWLRVNLNLPPSERGGGSDAFPEQSGTIPKAILGQQQSSLRQLPRRRRRRRAPGTIAGSRSSDEILQRNTNVALSPVTGPGATSFSSVASAFDFHHHLGSDPASELLVLKHILTRECLLSRLETVCGQLRKRFQLCPATATSDSSTARLGEVGNDIVNLLSSMRNATVAVIEAINVWRKDITEHPPSAFVWDGDNYLLKITNDLNFLAGVQPLVDTLKMHPARFCRNPLMLPQTLDEQRRDGELCQGGDDTVSSGAGKRRHLYQVAQVLLDEESLESERDALRKEASKFTGALPSHDGTSPDLSGQPGLSAAGATYGMLPCTFGNSTRTRGQQGSDRSPASYSPNGFVREESAVEDEETLRCRQRLSTWYEEARSQLVSLSTSPADEQYFLSSRRFWSKEELGDPGGGGGSSSSPPAHRHPSGHFRHGGHHRSGNNVSLSTSGVGNAVWAQRDGTGQLADGGGETLKDHKHRGILPPRQGSQTKRLRSEGQPRQAIEGGVHQRRGSDDDDDERGTADIWSRPDRFGGGNSAALSCLTVDNIEQILREADPSPATVAVCAAVVYLLAPGDQEPVDFVWPQGFEAVAVPAEDFLWRLHQASGGTASSAKAGFLAPVLQREYLLPEVIEQQGGHAVASLCAWVLEELQAWEEFAEWSAMALEPWYEIQLIPARADAPESDGVSGCEVRLVYKALHALPHVGGAYVMSLFEENSGEAGLIVRAFDRTKRDAFWLSLSKDKIDSFGSTDTRSSATLAAALARRLDFKVDVAAGTKRLVLPPEKKVKSSSERKKRSRDAEKAASSVDSGTVGAVGSEAEVEAGGGVSEEEEAAAKLRLRPLPSTEDPGTAEEECSGQAGSQPRRSHPPPTRGSTVGDLGPLLESQGDGSECSDGDLGHARSEPRAVGTREEPPSADVDVMTRLGAGAIAGDESEQVRRPPVANNEKTASSDELTGERRKEPGGHPPTAGEAVLTPSQSSAAPEPEVVENDCSGGGERTEAEERSVYADDFAPDDRDGDGMDFQGEAAGIRAEESGSYADDFAADEDDNYDEVDKDQAPAASKNGPDLSGVFGTSSYPENSNVPESEETGLVFPTKEVHVPRKSDSAAAAPQHSFDSKPPDSIHEVTGADSGGETADVQGREAEDDGYENEFLGDDGEQDDTAGAGVAQQANESGILSVAGEGSAATESKLPRHFQQDNGEPRQPSHEAASALRAPDESTADEIGASYGMEQSEVAQRVRAREVDGLVAEYDSKPRLKAEIEHQPVEDGSRSLIRKPIAVDMLGNVERGCLHEGCTRKFKDSSREDLDDKFGVGLASEIAAAIVEAVTGSALELVLERREGYVADVAGDTVSCTGITTSPEIVGEGSISSTGQGGFEEMLEDYADDGDSKPSPGEEGGAVEVRLVPEGTALPLEPDLVEEIYDEKGGSDDDTEEQPPTTSSATVVRGKTSLHEPEHSGEESFSGPVGEEIELDAAAVREDQAVELALGESSTAEDVDFEEDFEEDFDDDFDADATEGRPDEEETGVSLDVAEADEGLLASEKMPGDREGEDWGYSQGILAGESAVESDRFNPPNPAMEPTADKGQRHGPPRREGQTDLLAPAEGEDYLTGGGPARTKSVGDTTATTGATQSSAAAAALVAATAVVEPPDDFGNDFDDDFEDA